MSVRISVSMAVYNGEKYIRTQLDSIVKQLSTEDEVVISYNPSTDATWEIIKEYESKYEIVKVFVCEELGVLPNSKNSLNHCSGKYIFFADQDDCWTDNKVELVMRAFKEKNPPVVLHDMQYTDGELNPTGVTMFAERHSRPGIIRNVIKNSYHGGCMAMESRYLKYIHPVPKNIGFGDMWGGLVGEMLGKPVFIPEVLMLYRRHDSNLSSEERRSLSIIIPERIRLIKELYKRKKEIKRAMRSEKA